MSNKTPQIIMLVAVLCVIGATPADAETAKFGLGDVVYRKELKEPLPNAFGKADIFGRKRTAGFIEVRYVGFAEGVAQFARRGTQVLSNETTVTRSGAGAVIAPNGQVTTVYGLNRDASSQALPQSELLINVALGEAWLVDGETIPVLDATGSTVTVDLPAKRRR